MILRAGDQIVREVTQRGSTKSITQVVTATWTDVKAEWHRTVHMSRTDANYWLIVYHRETKYNHWEIWLKGTHSSYYAVGNFLSLSLFSKWKGLKKSASGTSNFMCHFKESLNRKFLSVAYIRKSNKFLSGLMPKDISLVFHQEWQKKNILRNKSLKV